MERVPQVFFTLFGMFLYGVGLLGVSFFLHFALALLWTFLLFAHALFFFKMPLMTLEERPFLCMNFNLVLRICRLLDGSIFPRPAFSHTSALFATLCPLREGSTWSPTGVFSGAVRQTLRTSCTWLPALIFVHTFFSCFQVSRAGLRNQAWAACSVFFLLLWIPLFCLDFFCCLTLLYTHSLQLHRPAEVCRMQRAAGLQLRPSRDDKFSSRGGRLLPLLTSVHCVIGTACHIPMLYMRLALELQRLIFAPLFLIAGL